MANIELCNDGRCYRTRLGEERHPVHLKIEDKFSNTKWNNFQLRFWSLMPLLAIVMTIISWKSPESFTSKIGSFSSVFAFFIAIYIGIWTYKTEFLKKQAILKKTNYAKEKIYSTLRSIDENRKLREKIRTTNPLALSPIDLQTEIRFMNRKLQRVIELLQFVLSLHSEHLDSTFVFRVNDAVNGYDFILNRLDVLPFENDDPKKVLAGDIEGFIEELKKLE